MDNRRAEANSEAERTRQAPVVLVDDDRLFLDTVAANLEEVGFQVIAFDNGADALAYFTAGKPASVALLDWRMPEPDGIAVLKALRSRGMAVPVIFLTSLNDQIYEEVALAGGAVDFVEKSRSFQIILSRIRLITEGTKAAVGPACTAEATGTGRIGALELRFETSRAYWKGYQVSLTLNEFRVVRLLTEHAGSDVSYRQIYDCIRGTGFNAGSGEDGYRANVRSIMKRIRQKFRDMDPGFDAIENYPGFGYRWSGHGATSE